MAGGLILQQPAIVVPFTYHFAPLRCFYQFMQSRSKYFIIGLVALYCIYSHPSVQRMERVKIIPCQGICLECGKNVCINNKFRQ